MKIPVITIPSFEGFKTSGTGQLLSTTLAANMRDYSASDSEKIEAAKEKAVETLRAQATEHGCNAIVGLKLDLFRTDDGQYYSYLVSAYATGVKVVGKES